jgi:hypothetical protein
VLSVQSGNPARKELTAPISNSAFVMSTLPGRMELEVSVHTAREKYPSSLRDESVFYMNRDHPIQLQCDNQAELSCDQNDDVENGV